MKCARYIDIPNFEKHKNYLLDFKYSRGDLNNFWENYQDEEIELNFPDLVKEFKDTFNLTIIQLVFFSIPNNDINITNPSDPNAVYIHVDGYHEEDQKYNPSYAINLPLENCEGSCTFFYKLIKENSVAYYSVFDCNGISPDAVEKIDQIELSKPAVIKVNIPHGVWNPNLKNRLVVTLRFKEDIEHLLND